MEQKLSIIVIFFKSLACVSKLTYSIKIIYITIATKS